MAKQSSEPKLACKVTTRKASSLMEEMDDLRQSIMQRAYEIFCGGRSLGGPLDDWLAAERELVWQPPIAVSEHNGGYRIEMAVPGIKAEDIEVQSTEEEILVKSAACAPVCEEGDKLFMSELPQGRVFRTIALPRKIDREHVTAELHDGLLQISVPAKGAPASRKVPVAV